MGGWVGWGWGGVKLASSIESVGPAHSHPPSHNIRNSVGRREERWARRVRVDKTLEHLHSKGGGTRSIPDKTTMLTSHCFYMWNGRYRIEGLAHVARSVSSDKDSYNMHFVSHVETTVDGFAFCTRRMGGSWIDGARPRSPHGIIREGSV